MNRPARMPRTTPMPYSEAQDPWSGVKSPAQKAAHLRPNSGQTEKIGKRVAEATPLKTKLLVAGTLAVGAVIAANGIAGHDGSINNDRSMNTGPQNAGQREAAIRGMEGVKPASESKAYQATVSAGKEVTVDEKAEVHKITAGENPSDLVYHHLVDADGQALTGDQSARVQMLQSEFGEQGLPGTDINLPLGTHYVEFDTQPTPTTQP